MEGQNQRRLIDGIIDWFLGDDAEMIIPFFSLFFLLIPMGMWSLIDPDSILPGYGMLLGLALNGTPLILSVIYPRGRNSRVRDEYDE